MESELKRNCDCSTCLACPKAEKRPIFRSNSLIAARNRDDEVRGSELINSREVAKKLKPIRERNRRETASARRGGEKANEFFFIHFVSRGFREGSKIIDGVNAQISLDKNWHCVDNASRASSCLP
ncbi:MAG TPA: hypothetical protein VMJ93_07590 [Verrucomicrobiae bacterium]|nr:hypothetical protein [Verrucomicrobiae bacterium]